MTSISIIFPVGLMITQ